MQTIKFFLVVLLLVSYFSNLALAKNSASSIKKPTHILFMVFDQMRPDYIDRFDLKNFKRLRKMSTNYSNAYVGHLASVTVVSHAVMGTGLLPKDLPWAENTFWDAKGQLGAPDAIYNTLTLAPDQLMKLLSQVPANQFIIKRLKDNLGKKVFTIGEKDYAALALGGPYSDSIIYAQKKSGRCIPFGVNVPERFTQQKRYNIDCSSTYGTENSLYPLDGHRFYPGEDQDHLGGDIWVADMALDIMKNEKDWGGLFLTFGAIDKFGHMLGETDNDTPHAFNSPLHLKDIAQIADAQLGRLLKELEEQKILHETLIISTADHGGQTDEIYLGGSGSGEAFWIDRVAKMAPLRFSSSDTGLRLWLKEVNEKNIQKSLNVLSEVAQVTQVFALDKTQTPPQYKLVLDRTNKQNKKYQDWARSHNLELVNTFANSTAPDLVAALADDVGFGKLGDHGGLQEKVQRIPMLVAGPGFKAGSNKEPKRLVDLSSLISQSFNLKN